MTRSIFEIGYDVVEIARRHQVEIATETEPASIIEQVHAVIYERAKSFKDDIKKLNRLRREIGGEATKNGVDVPSDRDGQMNLLERNVS